MKGTNRFTEHERNKWRENQVTSRFTLQYNKIRGGFTWKLPRGRGPIPMQALIAMNNHGQS
jgi:hypothetical protein